MAASCPTCPVCSVPQTGLYAVKDGVQIYRCGACKCGFVDLKSSGIRPEDIYRSGYHKKENEADAGKGYDDYYAMAPAFRRTFENRLNELLKHKAGGDLLEVGCGPGYFLELASRRFTAVGVEPAADAATYAQKQLGLDVREGLFRQGMFPASSFDAAVLFDTIEHLERPRQALEELREVLRPGGVLMLTTGDFSSLAARVSGKRWHLLTVPEHLFYFSREGLSRLLEKTGFEPLSVTYPHGHFLVDYLAERLVKSLGIGQAYLRLGGLRQSLRRFILPMNLWDIMLVCARKGS